MKKSGTSPEPHNYPEMEYEQPDYKKPGYPPGGILVWMLIVLELFTFGAGLTVFAVFSQQEAEVFHRSANTLNKVAGTINTMVLLTSGYFMKKTVVNFHLKNAAATQRYLHLTLITGGVFILIKGAEYAEKIAGGIRLDSNHFYTFYWLITGFHLIHVLSGMLILGYFSRKSNRRSIKVKPDDMEAGAAFWHMCDLIWLMIFPSLYLLL